MNSRFVNLLVRQFNSGRSSPFRLHRIDPAGLFRPTPVGSAPAASVENAPLPPVEIAFDWPCPRGTQGWREFMSFGPDRNNIVSVDYKGRTKLYSTAERSVSDEIMPVMEVGTSRPVISVDVGDSLYVMLCKEKIGPRPRMPSFRALMEVRPPGPSPENWAWVSLPPPPFDDGGRHYSHNDEIEGESFEQRRRRHTFAFYGARKDPFEISSYTVVGGSKIWVSTVDAGTYSFDTASHEWSKAGDWSLPFIGRAEYIPEHNLWFGFSHSKQQLCASDLTNVSMEMQPVLQKVWEDPDLILTNNVVTTATHLLPLSSGKFCICRFYQTVDNSPDESFPELGCRPQIPESYALLTGVEMLGGANLDGTASMPEMIKHRTQRYSFGRALGNPL